MSGCVLVLGRTPLRKHSSGDDPCCPNPPSGLLGAPRRRGRFLAAAALLLAALARRRRRGARADDLSSLSLVASPAPACTTRTTTRATYTYLANALDTGTSLVELDTWANVLNGKWDVSHGDPLASENNCVQASTAADLYTGDRNQNLDSCLDDIRIWMLAHPTHGPIMVKIEMKNGFDDSIGLDPTEFDSYIQAHLGSVLYTPADLLTKSDGTLYPNLDAAAQADNWGSYGSLEGKVIVEMIPGTFEQAVDPSSTWVDVVYAQHLIDLYDSGEIADAAVFPSVLGAQAGDPRTRYSDTALRPWFVVFDGDAGTWVSDGDTQWYDTNHYLTVRHRRVRRHSGAQTAVTRPRGRPGARWPQLAADGASYVSTDWIHLVEADGVLSDVLARG